MTLGDHIKHQRNQRRMTQEELASRANVRRPTITELETNRRMAVPSEILRRLARALGCTTDYLVGMYEDDDEEPAYRRRAVA
jgi:transcriptional regulator with XRE-family HTH domain